MTNDWIIDVLTDLRDFAAKNGLDVLAGHLEDTSLVAMAELSSQEGAPTEVTNWDVGKTGRVHRTVATR